MRAAGFLFAAMTLLVIAGCENHPFRDPPPPRGPQLEGEALTVALSGNSLSTVPDEIPPLTVYFDASGEMRGRRSHRYRDVGKWEAVDDALCGKWHNWWGAFDRCWQVYRFGQRVTLVRVSDGRELVVMLVPGNAESL